MEHIRTNPVDMMLIVVKADRIKDSSKNYFRALSECVSDFSDLSTAVIVN